MSIFDSSTPVPIGQDSPSTTVPFEIPTVKQLGDSPVLSHYGPQTGQVEQVFVDLAHSRVYYDGDGGDVTFKNNTDLHLHLCAYVNLWGYGLVVHEGQPQPVQQQQADAGGQNSPSVKATDVSPDPTSYNLPNNCPNCGSELDPYWHFDAWHCSSCSEVVLSVQLAQADASNGQNAPSVKAPEIVQEWTTYRDNHRVVDIVLYDDGMFGTIETSFDENGNIDNIVPSAPIQLNDVEHLIEPKFFKLMDAARKALVQADASNGQNAPSVKAPVVFGEPGPETDWLRRYIQAQDAVNGQEIPPVSDKKRFSAVTIDNGLCCVIIEVRGYDHDDAKREICSALYRPREPHRLNLFSRWQMAGEMVLMPGDVVWDNQGREWWQIDGRWDIATPQIMQLAQADESKYPVMDYPQTPMTQLKTVRTDNEAVDEVYFKGVFAGELVKISPMDSWEFRQKEKPVIFGHINNVGDFYGYPNKVIDYLQSEQRASLFENEDIEGQIETYSYYPQSEIEISSDSDTPIKVEAFLLGPNLAMHERSGMWTLTHVPTGCYFWRSRDVIELERLAWQLVDFDLVFSSVSDAPPELVAFGKKWRAERSEVFYE